LLRFALQEINRDPEKLLRAGREADEQAVASGGRSYPLRFKLSDKAVPYQLKAVEYHTEESSVSGAQRVIFGTDPLDITIPMYKDFQPTISVEPPLYYIIPPQWKDVIAVLQAHGLVLQRTAQPETIAIEGYQFSEIVFPPATFEGRTMPAYKTHSRQERRRFPAGSVIIPLAQSNAAVAIQLLEPEAADSFVAWGFFNAIFEQKEYSEDYVSEKLAREMMNADPKLRSEFEEKLATDSEFAASPRARLQFFYQRSPYWDPELNLYPVGRIVEPLDIKFQ
jgi:hypothetical protein